MSGSKNVFDIKDAFYNPDNKQNQFVETDNVKAYGELNKLNPVAKQTYESKGIDLSGGSGGTIYWNPSGTAIPTTNGEQYSSETDLGHEMAHGYDANRGLMNNTKINGLKWNEYSASYRENLMRTELGLPLRTYYGTHDIDNSPIQIPLLDSNNQPISLQDINNNDMHKFFSFAICLLLSGCNTIRNFKSVEYKTHQGHKLVLLIPKGYILTRELEGLDDGYKYKDSSIIYITYGSLGGDNYYNIEDANKQDSLLYIISVGETLILSGIDENGLYWKNHQYDRYSIGYKNVHKEKKAIYDKSVDSFKIILPDQHINNK